MRDPFFGPLDVAVKHGGIGKDAKLVRSAVYLEPFIGTDFSLEGFIVNTVVENLSTAAGHASQSGIAQRHEYLTYAEMRQSGEVHNLNGGERLDVQIGAGPPNAAQHVEIIVKAKPRVQPAD